ncbi:MAG: hypothetical protein MUF48_12020 [Pirellulaceae bacterium]|nr:hypothetical protein [Pirellulaceae bacterium]
MFARFYWAADTTADQTLREYVAFEYSPDVVELVVPALYLLERNVPGGNVGPEALEARDLLERADLQLTPAARQAWRWRILYLRAQIDAQLHLNRGVLQGRVLHESFQELTRIYHAQNAEPQVRPPAADPTEPERGVGASGTEPPDGPGVVVWPESVAYWRVLRDRPPRDSRSDRINAEVCRP